MSVGATHFWYRPYPWSLGGHDRPNVFASWVDLWAALTRCEGPTVLHMPTQTAIPPGYWDASHIDLLITDDTVKP